MDERTHTPQIGPEKRCVGAPVDSFQKSADREWTEAAGRGRLGTAMVVAVVLLALSVWLVATGRISYDAIPPQGTLVYLISLDTGLRLGAVAFAFAAGERNHLVVGPVVALVSPLVFVVGAVAAFLDERCFSFYDGVCGSGEPNAELLVGFYLLATAMLAAGVLLACLPEQQAGGTLTDDEHEAASGELLDRHERSTS